MPSRSIFGSTRRRFNQIRQLCKAAAQTLPFLSRDYTTSTGSMNSSMNNGGQGYPQDTAEYGVDPTLLNESSWALPSDQYVHNDAFVSQQSYQQYSTPSTSYASYGIPQDASYQVPTYTGPYGPGPQYQQANHMDHYPVSQYALPHSQASSTNQQSFQGGVNSYPYSQFGQETATISPHALQRGDGSIIQNQAGPRSTESQRGFVPGSIFQQTWDRDATNSYQPQGSINPAATYIRENTVQYPSLNTGLGSAGQIGKTYTQGSEISRNPPARRTQTAPPSHLRVTHADLLSQSENMPSRRLREAPFVVLDDLPIQLDNGNS